MRKTDRNERVDDVLGILSIAVTIAVLLAIGGTF